MYLLVAVGVEETSETLCHSKKSAQKLMRERFTKFLKDYDIEDVEPDIRIEKADSIEFACYEDYQSYFVVEAPKSRKEEIELLLREQERAIDCSSFNTDMIEELKHYTNEIRKLLQGL